MKRWKWSVAGVAVLGLIGFGALWQKDVSDSDPSPPRRSEAVEAPSAELRVEAAEGDLSEGAGTEALGEDAVARFEIDAPEERIGLMGYTWTERYPEAETREEQIFQLEEGRYRRQQLISTGSERIPWVVWEDKILLDEAGEPYVAGTTAWMADAFIVSVEGVDPDRLEAYLQENGLALERRGEYSDSAVVRLTSQPTLGRVEAAMLQFGEAFPGSNPEVDGLAFTSRLPSDWDAAKMWGLDAVYAPDAWEFETGIGGPEVVVAVIDTGMAMEHPDLRDQLVSNPSGDTWDFVDYDPIPEDTDGHGTHVAGTVGAATDNALGAVGVSWGVKLLPLKVGDADGLRTSAIHEALEYVRRRFDEGLNVVATNNSYGSGSPSQRVREEIRIHNLRGILFAAAAGNDGKNMDASADALEFPAGYEWNNIISVANSNQEDGLNVSSNTGATSVDIAAPGSEIYSTYLNDGYAFLSGTSMASPLVAGAVAVLAQAEPGLSAAQIKQRLLDTADPIASHAGRTASGGRLNLLAALEPSLSGHGVVVTNIADAMVLVDSAATSVSFQVEATAGATISAEIVEGDAVGDLLAAGEGIYMFDPETNGYARIQFSATLLGIERSVERSIVVGPAAASDGGLLHHYDFEGNGATEPDQAGNSSGIYSGTQKVDTEYGRSLSLGGSNAKMSFDARFSNQVTIAALVRSENLFASPHPRIVNTPSYYLYFSSGEGAAVPDGNRQTLKFYSDFESFGVWNAPPNSIRDNQWYYVVGSFDSRSNRNAPRLYINGAPQVARMQQEPRGGMRPAAGSSYVGNNGTGDRSFAGQMADVRVYDRMLSQREIVLLGAELLEEKWRRFKIVGPGVVSAGEPVAFTVEATDQANPAVAVDWRVESEGASTVASATGNELSVRFDSNASYRLVAQVSDGVSTRFFSKTVATEFSEPVAGFFAGETSGGGLMWMEVDPSLSSGYISVYDPASGYYRFDEPVTIDASGAFETGEDSVGRIVGSVLERVVGEIAGYDVQFAAELQTPVSSESPFAGDYHGGALGVVGDSVALEARSDGRAFLWREGPQADLAQGQIAADGRFAMTSGAGVAVEGRIDRESGTVTGVWGGESLYLKSAGAESAGRLHGVFLGGFASGYAGSGVYGSFVGEEQEILPGLSRGDFAATQAAGRVGRGIILNPAGSVRVVPAASAEALVEALARDWSSDDWTWSGSAVEAIRAQLPTQAGIAGVIGFEIGGSEPAEVLARGLGQAFSSQAAFDPALRLIRVGDAGDAVTIGGNDDWREGVVFTHANERSQGAFLALEAGFERLGLSALADEAQDAALRVWLEPGRYLMLVEGDSATPRGSLLEVFELR